MRRGRLSGVAAGASSLATVSMLDAATSYSYGTQGSRIRPHPSRRGMLGSSVGQIMLKDSKPPATKQIHDWYSKMSYKRLPFTAGFFCLVDERGAKVPAAWRVNLVTSLSRSTSATVDVDGCSAARSKGQGNQWAVSYLLVLFY